MTESRHAHPEPPHLDRRGFVRRAAVGAAAVAAGSFAWPAHGLVDPIGLGGRAAPGRRTFEPWARLERIGEDVWAAISTPLADHPDARRTVCNGGLVAGREGVLAVEGFGSVEGAAWLAREAVRLTGRAPTHVVLTHYHGDHTTGTAGYLLSGRRPEVIATATTRRLIAEQEAAHPADRGEARPVLLPDVVIPDDGEPVVLDLGGRDVRLVARRGHTPSDLVVEVGHIVFPGDLVWNGMFPNYVDAIPSRLAMHVRHIRDLGAERYVSGHGELADGQDLDRYISLLEHVEAAARKALASGRALEDAAEAYAVPDTLGEWYLFSPRYPLVAFTAWQRELGG